MRDVVVELLEPLALVVYAFLASILAVLGVALEWAGVFGATGAIDGFALWQSYMGLVALAAAVTIVREELLSGSTE